MVGVTPGTTSEETAENVGPEAKVLLTLVAPPHCWVTILDESKLQFHICWDFEAKFYNNILNLCIWFC